MELPPESLLTCEVDSVSILLLGTAHIAPTSMEPMMRLLAAPSAVALIAVELCPSRHAALLDPESLARLDLFSVVRNRRVAQVAASLALAVYQQRLAEQCGSTPGAELRVALQRAAALAVPVALIDRDLGTTFKRLVRGLGIGQRLRLFAGLIAGLLSHERVCAEELERLKRGDVLEAMFAEFARNRQALYRPLIAERDRYMAARLRQEARRLAPGQQILAIIGAGHLAGVARALATDSAPPAQILAELDTVPPPSRLWKILPWALVALVLGLFGYGFATSPALGWELIADWILINGTCAALGVAAAGAHIAAIVGAFCVAPLTALNPTIGAGTVAALIELLLRRPNIGAFARLRDDLATWRGWWHNPISRVLLVFVLGNLASTTGTALASFYLIERILGETPAS